MSTGNYPLKDLEVGVAFLEGALSVEIELCWSDDDAAVFINIPYGGLVAENNFIEFDSAEEAGEFLDRVREIIELARRQRNIHAQATNPQ
jgi:hypothetical protein